MRDHARSRPPEGRAGRRVMDVVPLPPRPEIEHYRSYARDLASGDVKRWRAAIGPPASDFVRHSIDRAVEDPS